MRNKLLKLWAVLICLISSVSVSAYDFKVDGLYYNIVSTEERTVQVATHDKDNGHSYTQSVINIPKKVIYNSITYSVTGIGEYAFFNCYEVKIISIPNSIKTIYEGAFVNCASLTSITIPNSVEWIFDQAFVFCENLTSIDIPSSVKYIGDYILLDCPKLEYITVDSENTVYDSRNNCNAIIHTSSNILKSGCKNTTIPNSVAEIGPGAFDGCDDLKSINIPNSVIKIGASAFSGCVNIESVSIPNSVTYIGYGAFSSCESLKFVILPDSITQIASYTFAYCYNLNSVTIPMLVTTIGDGCFESCYRINSIYCQATTPPACNNIFNDNILKNAVLYVPKGYSSVYESEDPWRNFWNIYEKEYDGIEDVNIDGVDAAEVARYDIHGRLLTEPTPGINIVKYSDGSTRKEIVK